ncbi:MAG: hypothetical protein RL166_57 [Actinomycetota bacterium]
MEWLKNQLLQARAGEKDARRKLLVLAVGFVVAIALLVSGQTSSEPIKVKPRKPSSATELKAGYIHISGAVVHPGVYPISIGTRLFEVIAMAGGFTAKADRDSVNLARTVTDGEQVVVSGIGSDSINDGLIHLNKATAADLDKLPGIGPTLSERIIDWRNANGGFKKLEDLRRVGGIGDKLFAGIKKLVTL